MSIEVQLVFPRDRYDEEGPLTVWLSRVPVKGESIDFDESFDIDALAGESFTVHHVAHNIEYRESSPAPSVILRTAMQIRRERATEGSEGKK